MLPKPYKTNELISFYSIKTLHLSYQSPVMKLFENSCSDHMEFIFYWNQWISFCISRTIRIKIGKLMKLKLGSCSLIFQRTIFLESKLETSFYQL